MVDWNIDQLDKYRLINLNMHLPISPDEFARKWKGARKSHHIDQLHEGEAKPHVHFLRHILHWSDEFIVSSEQISHQSLFILGA